MRGSQSFKRKIGFGILPGTIPLREKEVLGSGLAIFITIILVVGLYSAPDFAAQALAGVGIGVPTLFLIWLRPELGILGLVFLTSSFVPANFIDIRLPIGGGLDFRDLLLIGLFGLLFFRELSRKSISIPWLRVGSPLVLFLILAVFSALYAIAIQKVETNWALNDLRILVFYVLYFIVTWSIKKVNQLYILIAGLFLIADLTTSIMLLQQFAGANNLLLEAMSTTREWRVYEVIGGVRVIPAGQVLMHFMWFIALGMFVFPHFHSRLKGFFAFQILFIGMGHILSMMRAQWSALFLGFVLICLVLLPKYRSHLPKYSVLSLAIIMIMALIFGIVGSTDFIRIPLVNGVIDRFSSLLNPEATLETNSLQWRLYENGKAVEAIRNNPLFGVGLGGRYRPLTIFQGEALGLWSRKSLAAGEISRFTRYVHNSYLSIAVKMGIPGLIFILWFCVSFLICGWMLYQKMLDHEYKGMVLGIITGFIGLMAWSFFHAHFIKAESTPIIGLMTGLVAVIGSLFTPEGNLDRKRSTANEEMSN